MVDADFRNSYGQGYRDALTDMEQVLDEYMKYLTMGTDNAFTMADRLAKRIRTLRQASYDRKAGTE